MHSHPATRQDEWVLDRVGVAGIFCEVGAYDGLTHSNTLLLEREGWVGSLVEGHGVFAIECKMNRPYCEIHHKLIGDGSLAWFIVGDQYSGVASTMPKEFLYEHKRRGNAGYWLKTHTLAEVIGAPALDYLSIDTEGGEYSILSQWFEDGGTTRSLSVEFRYDKKEFARLKWLMENNGMYLDEVRGFDLCFLEK